MTMVTIGESCRADDDEFPKSMDRRLLLRRVPANHPDEVMITDSELQQSTSVIVTARDTGLNISGRATVGDTRQLLALISYQASSWWGSSAYQA